MYKTFYKQKVSRMLEDRLQQFVAQYHLEEQRQSDSDDNYMAPAWSKTKARSTANGRSSDTASSYSIPSPVTPCSPCTIRRYDECDWNDVDAQFDANDNQANVVDSRLA